MILVTGATGRIGRHLVKALLDRGEEIRILLYGNEKVPFENVEVHYGDITDKETVRKAMYHCDTVFHLAAVVDYSAPKDLMYNVNVLGTKNVATFGRDRKVIYLSSTSVYGYKPKENPATEKTPCKPSNFYGRTKHLAEKLVLEINGTVVRSPDVFGTGFTEGYSLVFDKLAKQELPMIGKGNNFIHWIHINDLVQAMLLAYDKGKLGEVYLVAGKEAKTLKELIEICCRYLNVTPPEKSVSKGLVKLLTRYKTFRHKLGGEKPELISEYIDKITSNRTFDIRKAETELGFKPQVEYEQAIREMVEEFLNKQQNNVSVNQGNQ